ncbi:MAG: KpsF/GutQ family sugar-phosphate isomerase [Lewinellaceae bacterium]|nr:KpsF/GutQ family sugar-phosphate isomerase [Lewinellaceae bacterium]
MEDHKVISDLRHIFEKEGQALMAMSRGIDETWVEIVDVLYRCRGRIVVTGIGKSANVGAKIVGTFNSTGTKAVYMHAADAIHGDLGMVEKDDIILCISKSGNTAEIKLLVQLIKDFGNTIIGMTSGADSYLAQCSDYTLMLKMEREADPNDLAPTTSTTLQMAAGDALAIALQNLRGFDAAQFAKFHPGGSLGKKLFLRVEDIITHHSKPSVPLDASIEQVIISISTGRLGATVVLDQDKMIKGIITDGDLRRMLQNQKRSNIIAAKDIMSLNPKMIQSDAMATDALDKMRANSITQLVVIDKDRDYLGLIHLHDILREGLV